MKALKTILVTLSALLVAQCAAETLKLTEDSENECRIPENLPTESVCQYIQDHCDDSNFKYLRIYYCSPTLAQAPAWMMFTGYVPIFGFLFFVLGLLASNFLTPNLTFLSGVLNMGEKLSGLTLLAFANGAPDIMSTWVAMNSKSTSLAIGELIGSANFALTVVIGSMAIVRPFKVDYQSFVIDVSLFGVLILLSFLFLFDGKIKLYESATMCVLYAAYIAINIAKPPRPFAGEPSLKASAAAAAAATAAAGIVTCSEGCSSNTATTELTIPVGDAQFNSHIEDFENGRSLRLMLPDSLKLAFKTYDTLHLKNVYTSKVVALGPHDVETNTIPIPAEIIVTPASAGDELEDGDPQPVVWYNSANQLSPTSANDELFVPQPLTRTGSSASIRSSTSSILSSIESETYILELSLFGKLLPNYRNLMDRQKPFESTYNVLTAPLTLVLNLLIPTPTVTSERDQDLFEQEQRINMMIFNAQVFLAPTIIFQELSTKTVVFGLGALFVNALFRFTADRVYKAVFAPMASLIGFVTVLELITRTATEIVNLLKNIGIIYGINESLLGLTVLSIGNSIGDLITNSTLSSLGFALTGLHACFGSPLLYILLGVGLNSLIIILRTGRSVKFEVDAHLRVSSFSLLLILLFYLVVVPCRGWRVDRLTGYFGVLIWVVITVVNVYVM